MLTIPNILTLIRLLMIPVFLWLFYSGIESARFWAALVFVLAAITDALDGYLARKLEQSTPFGAFLDPVVDKVMVVMALVLVTVAEQALWMTIPALIMISREIIISALREWMAGLGQRAAVAVSGGGKLKTIFQMVALIGLIWQPTHSLLVWVEPASVVVLYLATLLTISSMVQYIYASRHGLISEPEER